MTMRSKSFFLGAKPLRVMPFNYNDLRTHNPKGVSGYEDVFQLFAWMIRLLFDIDRRRYGLAA
jgi:hypothetical protein